MEKIFAHQMWLENMKLCFVLLNIGSAKKFNSALMLLLVSY